MTHDPQSPPSPPSLSVIRPTTIHGAFTSLRGGGRTLFRRLFIALWRYLWPLSKLTPIAHGYAVKRALNSLGSDLTLTEWFVLCRFYLLSGGGSYTIDSRRTSYSDHESICITKLCRKKLLARSFFDPLNPRLSSHRYTHPVFITFTPLGAQFYRKVLKRTNDIVMHDVMDYQPLSNKKGQP